ncbi:MAG: hypothetical protein HUJ83_10940 [Veillonella sp.]|nr:hypothetical protein [Veillonella sp.]
MNPNLLLLNTNINTPTKNLEYEAYKCLEQIDNCDLQYIDRFSTDKKGVCEIKKFIASNLIKLAKTLDPACVN